MHSTYTISFLFAVPLLPSTTRNMGILEILFLLSTTFSTVYADNTNVCPSSNCGSLSIIYPFKQQNTQTQDNCTYIDLNCKATLGNGTAIASLPYAGDFYVRDINFYYDPYIQLYDPGNCLMRRLMKNLSLSSSPFKAFTYENYTFYTCPADAGIIGYYFWPIGCLSNSTNSTVATAIATTEYMLENGCQVIGSWMLPVLDKGQFEFDGVNGDLFLTWNSTSCIACEDQTDQSVDTGGSKGISWVLIAESPVFLPSFVTVAILLIICLTRITKFIVRRNESNLDSSTADGLPVSGTATAAPPQPTAQGLDESKINLCTELVVLSESSINPGTDSHTCSICLERYLPQELVRSIAKCGHCFHANCIEPWLIKSRTCPVCRTILSANDL